MSKIVYTLRNQAANSFGLGSIGVLGPNEQRSFNIEEDSDEDALINGVLSQARVVLVSAVPLKTGGGREPTSPLPSSPLPKP